MAGPGADLHPINLQVDPATLPRVNTGPALIQRTMAPVNVVGGEQFPNAPHISPQPTQDDTAAGRTDRRRPRHPGFLTTNHDRTGRMPAVKIIHKERKSCA